MINKDHKLIIRYVIILCLMLFTAHLSILAYDLELAGKLTLQFAGIVASSYGVLTLGMKFIFQSEVSE